MTSLYLFPSDSFNIPKNINFWALRWQKLEKEQQDSLDHKMFLTLFIKPINKEYIWNTNGVSIPFLKIIRTNSGKKCKTTILIHMWYLWCWTALGPMLKAVNKKKAKLGSDQQAIAKPAHSTISPKKLAPDT